MTEPAHADAAGVDALELDLLIEAVKRRYGHDLRAWKRDRVRAAAEAQALEDGGLAQVQARLLRDPQRLGALLSAVLGRPPPLAGDAAAEAALAQVVLPILRTWPFLRTWYVGCGDGADVAALVERLRADGLGPRTRVVATDVHEVEATCDGVLFGRHVPLTDGCLGEFGLVVCRHQLEAVHPDRKEALLMGLHDSVVRFGVLWLGPGESLRRTHLAEVYETLDLHLGIHRRIR